MALPAFYNNFSAGLNTKAAPYLLDEGLGPLPTRDCSNVQSTVLGAIVKRPGFSTFATPANAPQSLFAAESLSPTVLIATQGADIDKISTVGTVTQLKTGLTSGARWEFVNAVASGALGPVYGMNGVDTPQSYTGAAIGNWTNNSGAVAVPNGTFCIYANNQVFVTGVAANPSTVYWSAIGNPGNWDPASLTGAGSVELDPGDGQAITGIGVVGPYVLVFKPRKTWVITDTATAANRRLSDQIGCVAHRSIVEGSAGTFFLSEDRGVYITNGSKLTPISDQIQPTIDLVDGEKQQSAACYFNGHYYLSVAGAGAGPNDTILDFDTTINSWWRHTQGSNQFAIWHPTAGSAQLYSAKATSAIVDQAFVSGVNTDNGTAFTWAWRGPWQSPSYYRRRLFPTPFFRKMLRQVRIEGVGTVDFSIAKDFAGLETLWQSDIFGSSSNDLFGVDGSFAVDGIWANTNVGRNRFYSLGVANAFSIVFSATSTTADVVYDFDLMLTDMPDQVIQT